MPGEAMSTRTGRRPGPNATRGAIVRAARRQFAELGYDRTTMRSIAGEAGVDPALVIRFFTSKQQLFLRLNELPFDAAAIIPELVSGPRGKVGERLARFIVGMLETQDGRARITSMVRAAAAEPAAADLLRELLSREVFGPLAESLGADDAALRANLVGSQVVGLVMARYVVGVEPLASLSGEEVSALIAPTLQRYLTRPLPL
jgi:AcrR family transcriptional regulator